MRTSLLLLALAGLRLVGQDRPEGPPKRFSTKEEALANVLATQVRRQTAALDIREVDSYVEGIGRRLAAQMPAASVNWRFGVIRNSVGGPVHEPISLPDGSILAPAALLLSANNEDELAGMLAHAMAHLAEKHPMRTLSGNEVASLASIPLVFFCWSGTLQLNDERSQEGFASYLAPVSCLKSLREAELEADRFAAPVMASTGYAPDAFLTYIRRMQPDDRVGDQKFSRFPSGALRISQLEAAIANTPKPIQQPFAGNFDALQQQVRSKMSGSLAPSEVQPVPSLLHPKNKS